MKNYTSGTDELRSSSLSMLFAGILVSSVFFFVFGYYFGSLSIQSGAQDSGSDLERLDTQKLTASVNIVSVTSRGEGSLNEGIVEVIPGSGKILFSINPFVEPDTQNSLEVASVVAQKFTGKSLSDRDLLFSVAKTDAKLIGGPSAGAAFTVATIAAIGGKAVRADAAITGTVNKDGSIGQIGGVIEKAVAAAEKGLKVFVVPKGQKIFTYYEPKTEQSKRGNFTVIRRYYMSKTIDIQDYLVDQNYDMKIIEANDIGEATNLLIKK